MKLCVTLLPHAPGRPRRPKHALLGAVCCLFTVFLGVCPVRGQNAEPCDPPLAGASSASPTSDYLFEIEPKKVALVIGNENYRHLAALPSARADGEMMAQRLRGLGFETCHYRDVATVEQFEDIVLPSLRAKLTRGDFVVFYFSGHGFSYGQGNFIVPTQMPLSITKSKVTKYAIPVDSVKDFLVTYRPGLIMFFIDACRSLGGFIIDDGAGRNLVSKGYNEPKNFHEGRNSYIVYATEPGHTAAGSDTAGQMSIFTRALYERLGDEGKPFNTVIDDVSAWVLSFSEAAQNPGAFDWSKTDPYFRPTPQNFEQEKRIWLATLEERDALKIETFYYRYSVSRHAEASRRWLADDLYRDKPDPHTSVSPAAVERAWRGQSLSRVGIRRLPIPALAFERSLEESQGRALSLLSDAEIGLVPSGSTPRPDDALAFSLSALTAHGKVVAAARGLEARAEPDTSAAAKRIPAGALLTVRGTLVGADNNTYLMATIRGEDAQLYVNISQLVDRNSTLELGLSLKEVIAPPRSEGNSDLIDPAPINEAVAELRARGYTITWVSLSTAAKECGPDLPKECQTERDARPLRLADAAYSLKQAGVDGTRITSVSGVSDFDSGGVRLRFFGTR